MSKIIGIDLGGWEKKTTGVCVLEVNEKLKPIGNYCSSCQITSGSHLITNIKPYLKDTSIIAVDGPLTKGQGKGKMRLWEKFLSTSIFRKAKINPLPPILMPEIVQEGLWLVQKLKNYGFSLDLNVIETFPTFVSEVCGTGKNLRKQIQKVTKKEIIIPPCSNSHQRSAFICALVAFLHSQNLTSFLGYRDGCLIVPAFQFWTTKWQILFKEAWQGKDYLKYRHLKTDLIKTRPA